MTRVIKRRSSHIRSLSSRPMRIDSKTWVPVDMVPPEWRPRIGRTSTSSGEELGMLGSYHRPVLLPR
jgi:hypothetical protein